MIQKTVLIVDDSDINRKILQNILVNEYNIIEAVNGKEALDILEKSYESISAVLLDIVMPVMDGYDVLISMRLDDKLARLPVIVTTGNTEVGAEVKALSCGANDFVTKPYNPEIIKRRLLNAINLHENTSFVRATQTDVLTGLYSRSAFLEKARELISAKEAGYYVMAYFDVDNFKVINDRYGNAKGDEVLKLIAKIFGKGFECAGGICSRVAADHFVVLYPKSFIESEKIAEMRSDAEKLDGSIQPITFSIGRYIIDDPSLPVSAMYDRASIAKLAAKKASYDVKIVHYDESMREKILDEQEIVNEMHSALEKEQFEIWLQPQYNHSSGALIGAEALVRWRHPEKGLVPPGKFIPVFENNGFIYEMDKYVWEHTCRLIRKWLNEERSPLPISVNVSRYDIFRDDFFEKITGYVEYYEIPIDMLRLEITESAFAQSESHVIS